MRPLVEWSRRALEIAGDRLFARVVVGVLGGLLLGIAGAGLSMLAFGSDSGAWALLLLWGGGIAGAIAAPDLTRATRWLLIISGLALLLLVFTSALVSDRLLPGLGQPLEATSHREDTAILLLGMLLGGLTLFAGLWIGRDPPLPPRRASDANDVTDNFVATSAARAIGQPGAARRGTRHNLRLVLLPTALGIGALLIWANRDTSVAPPAAVVVTSAAVAPAPAEPVFPAEPVVEPVSETAAPAAPALSASQIRQECMAQVEAARLFLAQAHASSSRGDYEVRIRDDTERFRREKPVGPRTLTLIATAMWSRREMPDPDTGVWTREYTRCEQVRSSGTFYVVRAQN